MKIKRIGIIGLGMIACGRHIPELKNVKECKITAICDIDENKLKTVVKHYGRTYGWIALIVCYIMTFNCFIMYHATGFSQKYLENERKSD